MKKILFITIDPIEYRRRTLNQIASAKEAGFEVEAISAAEFGKRYPTETEPCPIRRIYLPVQRGPLKFIIFNLKVFFKVCFCNYAIIHARGLWTLPAVYKYILVHRSRVVYEAHEYFAGHEIFQTRPIRKFIWLLVERMTMPYVDALITVSEPLARAYQKDYPDLQNVQVIRSLPSINDFRKDDIGTEKPAERPFTFHFHGYFHKGRALEQIILAFDNIRDLDVRLILIGKGPLEKRLKNLVKEKNLAQKIIFHDFIPNAQLIDFIRQADVGLALIQADSINRKYSLPNKFFEYIMAGLPVLAGNIPTLEEYTNKYNVGLTADPDDIEAIAKAMHEMVKNKETLSTWRENCKKAAKELNWENEAKKMRDIYSGVLKSMD